MMNGISFGMYHSFDDLKLILNKKEIGSQKVKVKKIDVEGADGSLDLTEFFGEAKFEDVIHKFDFSTIVPQAEFLTWYSTVKNALHGKMMHIVFDDEPSFFYVGRLHVSSFTNEKNIGIISIEADCEPWKYKSRITNVTSTISGSGTITLMNSRKRVVPLITTTATMTIEFDIYSITRNSGTFIIPELELHEGSNIVTVTGTGNITFSYQEGGL